MKRPLLSGFVAIAVATILVVGLAARARRVSANMPVTSRHALPAGARLPGPADDPVDQVKVVRFARNPALVPPFLVPDLSGNVVSTASFHGKVVLLNFWATWCPPCRDEIPELIELAARYKDNLQIIGVSMDDAPADEVRKFAQEAGINYPVIMGSRELSGEYGGVPALPTAFVVNRDGRIVQKHVGLYPIEIYEAEVRALLGLPVRAAVETFEDTGQIFLKNASQATELPGVSFAGLTPDEKRAALKRMNSEKCTCGCGLTIAQCRINDTDCSTSKQLAEDIVNEIRSRNAPPPPSKAIRQ